MPSGIEAFIEMLSQFGVRYIFGNPGTTELPLNDALITNVDKGMIPSGHSAKSD